MPWLLWGHLVGASGHEVFSLKILSLKWNLLHGQAVSSSTAPFLSLVAESTRLFHVAKHWGNRQICHIMTQTCTLLESNLGQCCKKACLAARAYLRTLSQNDYSANRYCLQNDTLTDITSNMLGPDNECRQG